MRLILLSATAIAAALLAACASPGYGPYDSRHDPRYSDSSYYAAEFGRVVAIETSNRAGPEEFRIAVRLDGGGTRSIVQAGLGDIRIGDRVRVENGRAFRS